MYLARRINDPTIDLAIKVIKKESLEGNPLLPHLMIQELSVIQKCSHPYTMNVSEVLQDETNFYIVSECLKGGELFEKIING